VWRFRTGKTSGSEGEILPIFRESRRSRIRVQGQKFRDELRQLSKSIFPRLVVLDVSGLKVGIIEASDPNVLLMMRDQTTGHPKISGLWPLTRTWSDERWVYYGPQFDGVDAEVPLGDMLYRRIVDLDKAHDPLEILRSHFEK